LAALSRDVLGEETEDPERARELLETGGGRAVSDPMPHADAFDILVGLSETIPMSMTHDIDEFDMQRGKVKLRGIVDTAADAKKIAKDVEKIRCVKNVKTGKITQVVNNDQQKYSLEFDVRCPEDQSKSKTRKAKSEEKETGE
jgi:general secretion pathway protein L